jgi:hypothetical protein
MRTIIWLVAVLGVAACGPVPEPVAVVSPPVALVPAPPPVALVVVPSYDPVGLIVADGAVGPAAPRFPGFASLLGLPLETAGLTLNTLVAGACPVRTTGCN